MFLYQFLGNLALHMAPAEPNSSGGATQGQPPVKAPANDAKKKDEKKDEDLVSL